MPISLIEGHDDIKEQVLRRKYDKIRNEGKKR